MSSKKKVTFSSEQKLCVASWIEYVTEKPLEDSNDLFKSLKSGTALCHLITTLAAVKFPTYHTDTAGLTFKEMENIAYFMQNSQKFGVKCGWTLKALHKGMDMDAVIDNIVQLSEKAKQNAAESPSTAFRGPFLDFNSPLPTPFNMDVCKQLKQDAQKGVVSKPSLSTVRPTLSTPTKTSSPTSETPSSPSTPVQKKTIIGKRPIIIKKSTDSPSTPTSPVTTVPTIVTSPANNETGTDSPRSRTIVKAARRASITLKTSPIGPDVPDYGAEETKPVDSPSTGNKVVVGKRPIRGTVVSSRPVLVKKSSSPSIAVTSSVNKEELDEVHDERSVLHNITQLKIMTANASPEYLQALATLINQQDKEWVSILVKEGAVKLLGDILQKNESKFKTLKQNTIQEHCIDCLKAIADSESFTGFLKNKKTINAVALLLDMKCRSASNYKMKSRIYELLALLCTYSEDGFWATLDAMTAYKTAKKEANRFADLVDSLVAKNRAETKVSTITKLTRTVKEIPVEVKQDTQAYALLFINALINSPKDQSTRAFIREEFKRLGATSMVEEMRAEIDKNIVTSKLLITQVKVFEEEMLGAILEQNESDDEAQHSDDEDKLPEEIDAMDGELDIDDLLKALRLKLGSTTGGITRLNELLRSLLKLTQSGAKDSVQEASMKAVAETVAHMINDSLNKEEKGQVDEILNEISNLNKKIKLLEKERELSKSTEKILDQLVVEKENTLSENATLKTDIKALQDNLVKLSNEKADIEEQLKKLKAEIQVSNNGDSNQVVSQLRKDLEDLRSEMADKEKKTLERIETEIAAKIESQLANIEKSGTDIPQIIMPQSSYTSAIEKAIDGISYKHFLEMEKLRDKLQENFENGLVNSSQNNTEDTIITQLRLEVKMLKQQRNTLLKKLEEGNASTANSQEVSKLKQEIEKLKRDLESAKNSVSQVVTSGVPPPPPSDGVPSVPPPPTMDSTGPPPPPPPMMNGGPPPPPPMMNGGPPPPPPMNGGPPPPPMMGGPPGPPGPPMMGMAKGPVLPKLPTLGTPSKQMKNFHCDAIAKNKVADTIWIKGGIIEDINKVQFDVSEIEDLFSNEAPKKEESTDSQPKKQKKELVSFVDPQKATNVALLLGYMRMSPQEIRDAILAMDEEKLSQGNIDALKDKTPSPDEIDAICAYTGDKDLLAPTDQFYLAIKDIPRLAARLNCWAFKYKFANDISQILPDVDSLTLAITEVIESNRFKRFLAVVLALTNFLNAKSAKKDSYGFKLKSLIKLGDTKSSKNNMSLLQYIAVYCEKNDPDLLELGTDIPHLEAATRVSLPDVTNEVKKLQTGIKLVQQEIEDESTDPNDKFVKVMKEFLSDANDQLNDINAALLNLEEQLTGLTTSYAEDSSVIKNPTDFLQLLKRFFAMFQDSYKAYQRKIEQEAKKQKQALLAESMKQKMEERQSQQKNLAEMAASLSVTKSSERSNSIMDGSAFRTRRYSRFEQKQAPPPTFTMPTLKKTGVNLS